MVPPCLLKFVQPFTEIPCVNIATSYPCNDTGIIAVSVSPINETIPSPDKDAGINAVDILDMNVCVSPAKTTGINAVSFSLYNTVGIALMPRTDTLPVILIPEIFMPFILSRLEVSLQKIRPIDNFVL